MTILIFYSSLTGNTKKLASHLAETLQAEDHTVQFYDTKAFLAERKHNPETTLPQADLILICFWCRRSSMDNLSLQLLSLYQGQQIAAAGTIGGDVKGPYGERVRNNAVSAIEEHNTCRGVFVCQGKIDEARTEARRRLPKTASHYLDNAGYARHLATRTHPDQKDLTDAAEFIRNII
ncbi:MAG: flavodoxin family protein [Lachnospiraceae bacterium]|nr:flavodoxin family protein [Lachnospiraceae bacterium]